jgi:hypothetical protein
MIAAMSTDSTIKKLLNLRLTKFEWVLSRPARLQSHARTAGHSGKDSNRYSQMWETEGNDEIRERNKPDHAYELATLAAQNYRRCGKGEGGSMTPLPEWIRASNERFARFSGSQFSPHELPGGSPYEDKAAVRQATKLCMDCRKREVRPRQKYCRDCAMKRKREANRRHIRRKRGLDVGKLANSPIGVEPLTKAEKQVGYPHPKAPILESSFPTGQEAPTRVQP